MTWSPILASVYFLLLLLFKLFTNLILLLFVLLILCLCCMFHIYQSCCCYKALVVQLYIYFGGKKQLCYSMTVTSCTYFSSHNLVSHVYSLSIPVLCIYFFYLSLFRESSFMSIHLEPYNYSIYLLLLFSVLLSHYHL